MADIVMDYLTRNPVIVPMLLFLIGMLAGVMMTWLVMRR